MQSVARPPDGAVAAAERGWAVIPLQAGAKTPRAGLSWPRIACADPARVATARWQPGENYGIACKLSGLIGLDLDVPKPGWQWPPEWRDEPGVRDGADVLAMLCERAGQPWPVTFWDRTPSGGAHLIFRAPPGRAIGNHPLGPLVDVRGGGTNDGGYLVGPGSVVGGRSYSVIYDPGDPLPELPGWIADLLDPPHEPARPAAQLPPLASHSGYVTAALRGEVDRVLTAPEGYRNDALNNAALSLGRFVVSGQLSEGLVTEALRQASEAAGLDHREILPTIRSGLRAASR